MSHLRPLLRSARGDGKKLDLHDVDETHSVDVELSTGAATAVENLSMQAHGHKLHYRRL